MKDQTSSSTKKEVQTFSFLLSLPFPELRAHGEGLPSGGPTILSVFTQWTSKSSGSGKKSSMDTAPWNLARRPALQSKGGRNGGIQGKPCVESLIRTISLGKMGLEHHEVTVDKMS